MEDIRDLKSRESNLVPVQIRYPAPALFRYYFHFWSRLKFENSVSISTVRDWSARLDGLYYSISHTEEARKYSLNE